MKKKNYFFDMLVVGVIGGLYAVYSQWRTDKYIDEKLDEFRNDQKNEEEADK